MSADQLELLLRGVLITLRITGLAVLLGTVIAIVGGVSALSQRRWIRWVTVTYVELFRGVAALILLFIAYYALPLAIGLSLSATTAAVLALSTNMGAYGTEIARGAINAIPRGQTEAGIAINLTRTQRYRYVILPQALITMLPPYGNLLIEVMKASALVSVIALNDLTRVAQSLRAVPGGPSSAVLFGTALGLYFVISLAITAVVRLLERVTGRGRDIGGLARGGAR